MTVLFDKIFREQESNRETAHKNVNMTYIYYYINYINLSRIYKLKIKPEKTQTFKYILFVL